MFLKFDYILNVCKLEISCNPGILKKINFGNTNTWYFLNKICSWGPWQQVSFTAVINWQECQFHSASVRSQLVWESGSPEFLGLEALTVQAQAGVFRLSRLSTPKLEFDPQLVLGFPGTQLQSKEPENPGMVALAAEWAGNLAGTVPPEPCLWFAKNLLNLRCFHISVSAFQVQWIGIFRWNTVSLENFWPALILSTSVDSAMDGYKSGFSATYWSIGWYSNWWTIYLNIY